MDMKAALQITANVKGQQEIDRLRNSMGSLEGTVGKVRSVLGALGAAFTAQQFGVWIKGTIDAADALNDLRQRTGIAIADLDALAYAAEQNGTSLETIAGSLGKLGRTMGDALGGNKGAAASLQQFGIGLNDLRSGSVGATEALARIADRIQQMPDGLQKAAALQKVFGKSAAELIPLLNAGGDAIRAARDELEGYGAVITSDFAAASDEFNDKLALLSRLSRGAAVEIGEELLPAVNDVLDSFLQYIRAQGGVTGAVEAIKIEFADLGRVIGLVGDNLDRLSQWSQWLDKLAMTYGPFSKNAQNGFFGAFDQGSQPFEITIPGGGLPTRPAPPKPKLRPGNSSTVDFDFAAGASAEASSRALEKRNGQLKQQNNAIDDYVLRQREALDLLRLEAQQVNLSTFEYEQLVEAKRHEYEVARATNDMLPETASRYKEVAASLLATKQEIERFNYAQTQTFEYGAKQAFQEYLDGITNVADAANNIFTNAFSGMEDALVEFVKTGKLDFSSLIDSMLEDLARLAIQQAVMGPLVRALGGAFGFANGGIMTGSGPVPLRTYAQGGIARSPQMALFGEGSMPEAYVPLPDGRNIPVKMQNGGSNVQVIVNNNSGASVNTNETQDGRGNRRIEVQIGEMVASEIRRSGSPSNMAIRQSFRTAPTFTGR